MKTLNTYTPNELKNIARRNFHTVIRILDEKNIAPVLQNKQGTRVVKFYGPEALEVVQQIRAADDAKKAEKQAKKERLAARRAEREAKGMSMRGGWNKKEKKETPIEVIQSVQTELPFDNGPSLRELVMETNRLLQEMLDFWKK